MRRFIMNRKVIAASAKQAYNAAIAMYFGKYAPDFNEPGIADRLQIAKYRRKIM